MNLQSLPLNHLILYNLNFSLSEFAKTVELIKEEKTSNLHLIYGKEDEGDNIRILNNRIPDRDNWPRYI